MTKREILETMRAHLKTMRRKCVRGGLCLYRKDGEAEGYGVEKCIIGALLPDEIAWPLYDGPGAASLLEAYPNTRPYLWPDGEEYVEFGSWASTLNNLQHGHDNPEPLHGEDITFPELVRRDILRFFSTPPSYIDSNDAALVCAVFGDDEWRACDAGLS